MANMVGKILFVLFFSFITINGQIYDPPNDSTQKILNLKPLKLYLDDDIPGADALNEDKETIANAFTQSEYELLVRQINVVGNGDTWITSAAKLDTAFVVGLPAWSSAHLVFQDVTGKGQVPFVENDLLFCQVSAQSGLEFDTNGTALDNDALIRRFVYVVDSVDGLNVYTIAHTDSLAPANKGAPSFGDAFVKVGNISTGADLIKFAVDQVDKDPRIEVLNDIRTWTDFTDQDKKIVVIGNIGGEVTSLGTVPDSTIGAVFRGDGNGNIVLDGVDIKLDNQSSIQISGFNNDAGYTDDTAADNAQATADSKILTFYQASAPSTSSPEGSIWFDSDDLNSQYRLESSVWVEKVGVGTGIGTYIDDTGVYTSTVVASQISAVNLAAISADLGTVTAGDIRSSVFSTNTGGTTEGVHLTDNRVFSYSSSVNVYSILSPSGLAISDGVGVGGIGMSGGKTIINSAALASSSLEVVTTLEVGGLLTVNGVVGLTSSDIPALPASQTTSGIFSTARLGSGTASSSTFLRGDGAWSTITAPNIVSSVSNTEFGYLDGVTSAIQTQLNSKAPNSDFSIGTPADAGYFVATSSGGSVTTELKEVVLEIGGVTITVLTIP